MRKSQSPLLRNHITLRRNHKALIADLKALLNTSMSFKDLANGTPTEDEVEYTLDEMLLKAFKVVTRGARFLDVWNEEVGLGRTIAELEHPNAEHDLPPTPASDTFTTENAASDAGDTERNESRLLSRSRLDSSRASTRTELHDTPYPRPASFSNKRISFSHRMSASGPSASSRNPNLASERLTASNDAFLGVLGSFIGLHFHSRSSTELVVMTQQAVQSCRTLVAVVEAVREHSLHGRQLVEHARIGMEERLAEFADAASEALRPADSPDAEVVLMPDEGKRLLDAATDCVRAAGNCLAKARLVLEQTGDFELDGATQMDALHPESSESNNTAGNMRDSQNRPKELPARLPPSPLQIPNTAPSTPGLTDDTTPSSFHSRFGMGSPTYGPDLTLLPSAAMPPPALEKSSFSSSAESVHRASHPKSEASEQYRRGVSSTGSSTYTYHSSTRDSEMSGVSQASTRATSPDIGNHYHVPSLKGSISHSTLAEENEETEANVLQKTYAHELIFVDGQLKGGSLRALVERLTAHQSTPDAMFVSTFYLTFRLFATPLEFAHTLVDRFEYIGDTPSSAGPVRLRVYNVFKGWLESHWRHDCDNVALDFIMSFAQTTLMAALPSAARRLVELVEKVSLVHGPIVPRLISSMGKTNTATAQYVNPETPLPPHNLSKKELNLLKQWKNGETSLSILDFDPLELARQLTIKECRIFCHILPEELLAEEWGKDSGSLAVNARALIKMFNDLTNLVTDSILQFDDIKKRAAIIKHWVKIADKCLELNNYDSLRAILAALDSAPITRLHRTWAEVSQKTKTTKASIDDIMTFKENQKNLRARLQNRVSPCLPFLGMYLTDLTMVEHGNSGKRNLPTDDGGLKVINFDKHMKTAKIISELQRFQIPYRLAEVPELQAWIQDELVRVLSKTAEESANTAYLRSLYLEPRVEAPHSTLSSESSFSIYAKDKFDFRSWALPSKSKSITTRG